MEQNLNIEVLLKVLTEDGALCSETTLQQRVAELALEDVGPVLLYVFATLVDLTIQSAKGVEVHHLTLFYTTSIPSCTYSPSGFRIVGSTMPRCLMRKSLINLALSRSTYLSQSGGVEVDVKLNGCS